MIKILLRKKLNKIFDEESIMQGNCKSIISKAFKAYRSRRIKAAFSMIKVKGWVIPIGATTVNGTFKESPFGGENR